MIVFETVVSTDGTSLWTNKVVKAVKITGLEITYVAEDEEFASLNAYFDTATWNIDKDGLVYTDDGFLEAFKEVLAEAGFAINRFSYSEQGMQGREYINFDVDGEFLKSWKEMGYTAPNPFRFDKHYSL